MAYYDSLEKSGAGFRMAIRNLFTLLVIVFILQGFIILTKANSLINELKSLKVPISNQYISKSTIQNYYIDFTFGITKTVWLPEEFKPLLLKLNRKLIVGGDRIKRENLKFVCDKLFPGKFPGALASLKSTALWSCLVYLLIPLILFISHKLSKRGRSTKHIRGSQLVPSLDLKKALDQKTKGQKLNLEVNGLKLPLENETSNLLVLGAPGTGKSVLLNQLIDQILERKKCGTLEKLIIYDRKGEFVSKWYRPGSGQRRPDILFFPYDSRTIHYRIFNDIEDDIDYSIISRALFEPSVDEKEPFWIDAARAVFKAGLIWCRLNGKTSNRDIAEFFSLPRKAIVGRFMDLPTHLRGAASFIEDERQGSAVISTLLTKTAFLEFMLDDGGDFSFRRYIRDGADLRSLFIPNIAMFKGIFRPVFTFVVDLMIREVLSMADDTHRRIWFILDEFSSLSRVDSLFDFLREARSKGGCMIAANQDLGNISSTYGRDMMKTFSNNFNTLFLFRANDPETSDLLSRFIGEREVHLKLESHQMSPSDMGDRRTISTQDKNERVILPSQIQNLENFRCYLKISNVGISKIRIPEVFYEGQNENFIKREFKLLEVKDDKEKMDGGVDREDAARGS